MRQQKGKSFSGQPTEYHRNLNWIQSGNGRRGSGWHTMHEDQSCAILIHSVPRGWGKLNLNNFVSTADRIEFPKMVKKQARQSTEKAGITTMDQVSAGGVAFRWQGSEPEMAIVSVKPKMRWQLPKGIVDPGETPEITAVREVIEEAGVETDLIALIETIEYWYQATRSGKPVRYHKFVHFYLLRYRSGDVSDHDHEIEEARWVTLEEPIGMLAFESERGVVEKAREMILAMRGK